MRSVASYPSATASMKERPSACSRSATASAAGMTGAAPCRVLPLCTSSSSSTCDATPLASAAAAADARPPAKTVASSDVPSPATHSRTIRAGGSSAPASADPSQSRMARCVSATTAGGRSAYLVAESVSARVRVRGRGSMLGTRRVLNVQTRDESRGLRVWGRGSRVEGFCTHDLRRETTHDSRLTSINSQLSILDYFIPPCDPFLGAFYSAPLCYLRALHCPPKNWNRSGTLAARPAYRA